MGRVSSLHPVVIVGDPRTGAVSTILVLVIPLAAVVLRLRMGDGQSRGRFVLHSIAAAAKVASTTDSIMQLLSLVFFIKNISARLVVLSHAKMTARLIHDYLSVRILLLCCLLVAGHLLILRRFHCERT